MTEEPTFGNILIIDDEKDNTEIIKDILEDVNYSTMLATVSYTHLTLPTIYSV